MAVGARFELPGQQIRCVTHTAFVNGRMRSRWQFEGDTISQTPRTVSASLNAVVTEMFTQSL